MVATDSYRLSVKETALEAPLQGSLEANVPARALQELARIAQQAPADSLAVSVGQNQVVFELGDDRALLAADRRAVPQLPPAAARVRRARAAPGQRRADRRRAPHQPARAEERAAAPQLQRGHADRLRADPRRRRGQRGRPRAVPRRAFEIGFNPEFLRDGLESIESDELVLKLISPLRPGLIESPDTGDFVYLIMPIRLNV